MLIFCGLKKRQGLVFLNCKKTKSSQVNDTFFLVTIKVHISDGYNSCGHLGTRFLKDSMGLPSLWIYLRDYLGLN